MPRFRLDVEYDGSLFAGWQRQADQPSVQQAIEQAIESFCGEQVSLRGAGRTDAGVHATGPQAARSRAASARARSSALHLPSPTGTSEPTIERTWLCRNERATAVI